MQLIDVIRARRSIRKYRPAPVPEDKVRLILEAGKAAPSAGNLQARDFYVIEDRATIEKLAKATFNQGFVGEAPLAMVVCANHQAISQYGQRGVDLFCVQDAAAAIQNMLLAIHDLGLASCWVSGFDEPALSEALQLPGHLRPIAILPVGEPAETALPGPRRDDDVHRIPAG